jgi:phospholipase/carboxylesterase
MIRRAAEQAGFVGASPTLHGDGPEAASLDPAPPRAPGRQPAASGRVRHLNAMLAAASVVLTAACQSNASAPRDPGRSSEMRREDASRGSARLYARPRERAGRRSRTGLRRLRLAAGRDSYLFVPEGYDPRRPAPFVMMLHGAGRRSRNALGLFLSRAPRAGAILFAPQSEGVTWDLTLGGYGRDVDHIDRALRYIFERYSIDPDRVAVEGFSDGASYALSLGLTNGDLFRRIVALSPGFVAPGPAHGRPLIFIAHGRRDGVLPLDSTSGEIVPRLRAAGYDVTYKEHSDGHSPRPRLQEAFEWLMHDASVRATLENRLSRRWQAWPSAATAGSW